ncbi:uncharacterized protein EAE97_011865 [Botrytis byssoidea]|uniref:Uncharacterized protein n=1 Tax=Botrytis byssoidea TaxID=139641 RepID=A0A9P5HUY8_9HELO|nr:uncharacterized protein EAE97_011865 [Botrytis byssoidea]KAF7918410.1 hypothetical protein EAE97_011865 [Botrytis byssoidea]
MNIQELQRLRMHIQLGLVSLYSASASVLHYDPNLTIRLPTFALAHTSNHCRLRPSFSRAWCSIVWHRRFVQTGSDRMFGESLANVSEESAGCGPRVVGWG